MPLLANTANFRAYRYKPFVSLSCKIRAPTHIERKWGNMKIRDSLIMGNNMIDLGIKFVLKAYPHYVAIQRR